MSDLAFDVNLKWYFPVHCHGHVTTIAVDWRVRRYSLQAHRTSATRSGLAQITDFEHQRQL
jgi:hypothetical protein